MRGISNNPSNITPMRLLLVFINFSLLLMFVFPVFRRLTIKGLKVYLILPEHDYSIYGVRIPPSPIKEEGFNRPRYNFI
jgi:hypothetical protein